MALIKWKDAKSAAKVKGPLRCHTCRLMCRDAEHYLSHKCEPQATLTFIGHRARTPQLTSR